MTKIRCISRFIEDVRKKAIEPDDLRERLFEIYHNGFRQALKQLKSSKLVSNDDQPRLPYLD